MMQNTSFYSSSNKSRSIQFTIILSLGLISTLISGVLGGKIIAFSHNLKSQQVFEETTPALPTRILDRNGNLITELFADEKRTLRSIQEISNNLVIALTTREDQDFFYHNGLSIQGTARAVVNILLGRFVSGGSTLTQQVAGYIYADRRDFSLNRKIIELWWAWNMEKNFTKKEILEYYLNYVPFGNTTYGAEAASQFFFRHSSEEMTPVEAAILVVQLSSPGRNSPYRNPERAKSRSTVVLNQMEKAGYFSQQEIDDFINDYWNVSRIWTISNSDNAYSVRQDKAPYFTEYIRAQMLSILDDDSTLLYKGGLRVYTTLDLDMQEAADTLMTAKIKDWNRIHDRGLASRQNYADYKLLPLLELLGASVNLKQRSLSGGVTSSQRSNVRKEVSEKLVPTVALISKLFGLKTTQNLFDESIQYQGKNVKASLIQSALVTLDNKTGGILAMRGGSEFNLNNQFNRAAFGRLQPGSTFKPFIYSEAIASKKFTAATHIKDVPRVFIDPNGSTYQPNNYLGELTGDVLLRTALSKSMNIPAVYVLSQIGFDAAIQRSASFLGVTSQAAIERDFPRSYPLALGVVSVSPLQLARAYSAFPNLGEVHDPYSIQKVTNNKGETLFDFTTPQETAKRTHRVLDESSGLIMLSILRSTTSVGTLANPIRRAGGLDFPVGGKTGTTQNWADAWAAGFSPAYSTVIWVGFDKRGNSLGLNLTGSTASGTAWAFYMKEIHKNIDPDTLRFPLPKDMSNLIYVDVSAKTGLLPTENTSKIINEIFLKGTEPTTYSTQEDFENDQHNILLERLQGQSNSNTSTTNNSLQTPTLNIDAFQLNVDGTTTAPAAQPNPPPQNVQRPSEDLLN